ncbi:fibronectin type III domain-containing protein [Halobacteriota archaeon]
MKKIRGDVIRKSTTVGLIGMLILSMLTMMVVPSVSGSPVMPAAFYGDVTVNGLPAPVGTVVTGRIVSAAGSPGEGSITVTEAGQYGGAGGFDLKLNVQTDNDYDIGKTIGFYVRLPSGAEGQASQTSTYSSGVTQLDLTATILAGTPPNITAFTPADTTPNDYEAASRTFTVTADQPTTVSWQINGTVVETDTGVPAYTIASYSNVSAVAGCWGVSAVATNVSSGWSVTQTWSWTVEDITPPAMVTGLTNDTPSTTAVTLSWSANAESDLAGYKVYQDDSLIATTTSTYYYVTGLTPSTTYEFKVSAYDIHSLEGSNATLSVTTPLYSVPTITSYTISNRLITPPQTTQIDVAFSEAVSAWIIIEDSNHDTVKQLYYSSSVTNPTAKTWDATYTNATVVPNGTYYVNVTGINTTTGMSVVNTTQTIGVGEVSIQYTLIKESGSTGKNWISIPLTTTITTASELMDAIGSNCDAVNRWNPDTQSAEGWISLMGGMGTNFAIVPGEGYEVSVTANTTFSVTGAPATIDPIDLIKESGSTGKNWIGLPYDTTLTTASTVMDSIGSNSDAVNRWNPDTQSAEGWISLMGGMGTNFNIVTGEGYEISVTGNTTWTPV